MTPIPMLIWCPDPKCGARHVDEGEFATKEHHTHACQFCGMVWRPAIEATVGVQFLPGFKNEPRCACRAVALADKEEWHDDATETLHRGDGCIGMSNEAYILR